MYLDEIVIGEPIKNYNTLCELLHEPSYQGGNQRKSQLEDFKRYFDYIKTGHKFIITDIYDEPLDKEDNRKNGNNSIYVKYIEAILLRYLSKQKDFKCILRKLQLWNLLGMINNKYLNIENEELQLIDSRMTSFEINHFYQRCNQKLDRILFTALNNLKNRCLLTYFEEIIIIDENDKPITAEDSEIAKLDDAKNKSLKEMGLINMQQVYCRFKNKEFYSLVNSKIYEQYGWKYTYKQYKLIYTPENIKEELEKVDVALEKLSLNEKVVDAINKQAITSEDKQVTKSLEIKAIQLGELKLEDATYPIKSFDTFEYPYCYVEIQHMLADELLNIGEKKFIKPHIDDYMSDFYDPELDKLFDGKTLFDK